MIDYVYEDYWPIFNSQFKLDVITGAIETGSSLYLIGSVGSFGANLLCAHSNKEKALAHLKELNSGDKSHYYNMFEIKPTLVEGE